MKTIDITNKQELGSGLSGTFFKLNKKQGVKVYFVHAITKKEVKYSEEYYNALEELDNLKRCNKLTKLTPTP